MSLFWWTGQQFSMACHLFAASASTASFLFIWFVVKIFWSNPEVWHVLAIFADMNKGDWFFGGDRKYFRGFSDWNLRRDELLDWFVVELLHMDAIEMLAGGVTVTNLLVTLHWGSKRAYLHFWSFLGGMLLCSVLSCFNDFKRCRCRRCGLWSRLNCFMNQMLLEK